MEDISINSISLDLEGWELIEEVVTYKRWTNSYGELLSVDFFAAEPDLPKYIEEIGPLRKKYRSLITESNGAIVEIEKDYIQSLLVIRSIFKVPQKPTGFTFLASYTIPREDFSFVMKVQCPERGVTGVRDTAIFAALNFESFEGWFVDPYDPNFYSSVLSNLSDNAEYDEHFPNHPLSRARKTLYDIKEEVVISKEILESNKFFLYIN